jgi:hypothetical protein
VSGLGCRVALTLVSEQARPWQPMRREQFRAMHRGDQLRDRQGRVWTVRAPAYLDAGAGEYRAVLVAGAEVLVERERFADSYMLLGDDA